MEASSRLHYLRSSLWSRLTTSTTQKLVINLMALVVIGTVFALLNGRFFSTLNATNVLRQVAPVIIVGAAVTPLMVSRQLDLSVGSTVALSGVVAALLSQDMALWLAFVIGALTGTVVGIVNAIVVVQFGINSVIATLGTLYVARGTANLLSGGVPVYSVPDSYPNMGNGEYLGIPTPVWIMLLVVAIFIALERLTLLGRYATAAGSNPEAAELSGIPVRRTHMLLYVLAGTMAGLAGIILSSRLAAGLPTVGVGFEFDVIVATILGGTSLLGGEGTVVGMITGALIVGVLGNGMNILGVPSFWQTVAEGVVLVLAVGLDVALRRRGMRRMRFGRRLPEHGQDGVRGLARRFLPLRQRP
jgi:ribose/xylose/arabinose/galactoside ABC-type transport system permease subunit